MQWVLQIKIWIRLCGAVASAVIIFASLMLPAK
jgi:hypothetical protein